VTRAYWLDTGELARGILLPKAFGLAIEAALPKWLDGHTALPTRCQEGSKSEGHDKLRQDCGNNYVQYCLQKTRLRHAEKSTEEVRIVSSPRSIWPIVPVNSLLHLRWWSNKQAS